MKKLIFAIMIVCLVPKTLSGQTGGKNFIDLNYIEVIGKSEMEIIPDRIYIKVNLNEKDTKNKISISELEKSMITTLQGIGIDVTKDLLIKDISSNFKYYLLTKNAILLTKEYQILVRDAKTAGQLFIDLEKIGISNVSIENLDNSNIEQFRREVKINAIKAAKDKAESLTKAVNQNIGRALYIQELDNSSEGLRNSNSIKIRGISSGIYGSNAPSPALDFDFEKIKIEYSVLCRFELK
jgi:uncharacterized protein YggE